MDDKTKVSFQVGDWETQVKGIFDPTAPTSPPAIAGGPTNVGEPGTSTRPAVAVAEPVPPKPVLRAQSFGRGAVLVADPNAKPDPKNPAIPAGMAQKDVDWRSLPGTSRWRS